MTNSFTFIKYKKMFEKDNDLIIVEFYEEESDISRTDWRRKNTLTS